MSWKLAAVNPVRVLAVGLSSNTQMRGVERVVYESLKAVCASQKGGSKAIEIELLMGSWQTYYSDLECQGVRLNVLRLPNNIVFRHLFTWLLLPFMSMRFDVLHLFNTIPISGSLAGKCVVTIHDLAEFACPHKYGPLQARYRRLVVMHLAKVADTILTVSDFSRRQIGAYLGRSDARVISNGIGHVLNHWTVPADSGQRQHDPGRLDATFDFMKQPYFLYYGVLERSKGLDLALAAFARLKSLHPECAERFVIAGARGNLFHDLKPYLLRDDVVYLGFVDDPSMATLIRRATAVLFLSEYEGFGFPALEAIALEARVIVSKHTVLEEICSPYCLVADPHDPDDVIAAMLESRSGKPAWDSRQATQTLSARFSWAATGAMLLDTYLNP